MNFLKIVLAQMSLSIIILGGVVNNFEKHLPIFIKRTFRYGKFASKESIRNLLKPIEFPKSWFKHFYVFSSVLSTIVLFTVMNVYVFKNSVPEWLITFLNNTAGYQRYATDNPAAVLLATVLLTAQCYKRFYETHFVSVFGKNGRINLTHYLVGYIHYAAAFLAILAEAPKFSTTIAEKTILTLSDISYPEIIATVLFLWAWWHQFKSAKILASLRKNVNGTVVSQKHHIPEGDLFEYVSSPHLFTEIVMYLALTIILRDNSTWFYVFVWVFVNQVEVALLSHWWYHETFPKYPQNRKVIIPFIF